MCRAKGEKYKIKALKLIAELLKCKLESPNWGMGLDLWAPPLDALMCLHI